MSVTRRHWSTRARRRIWERFNRTCQMCFQPTDERGFDLDHHIPLELGGEDAEENMRPLCVPCHRLKTKGDVTSVAKAKRREARHFGSKAKSKTPLPGGKSDYRKRTLNRGWVNRYTGEPL